MIDHILRYGFIYLWGFFLGFYTDITIGEVVIITGSTIFIYALIVLAIWVGNTNSDRFSDD